MEKNPTQYFIERDKNNLNPDQIDCMSNKSNKNSIGNKQSFQLADLQTKDSSHVSGGTHQTSFEFSESSFQNDQNRPQDFFREDFLLQRKVTKKELTFRQQIFNPQFLFHVQELLLKFSQYPNSFSFQNLLQHLKKPNIQVFLSQQTKTQKIATKLLTFKQVIQGLIQERKNWFFIYTFDLIVCPLTFLTLLIYYWLQFDVTETKKSSIDFFGFAVKNKSDGMMIRQRNNQLKHNIISIIKTYTKSHSQQINNNQVLLLLIVYFLDTLKHSNQHESQQLDSVQKKLIKDIKNLRKIKLRETLLEKPNNDKLFLYKLWKYEAGNIFIHSADAFYQMLRSHTLSNSSTDTMQNYYNINQSLRKQYQTRKDLFCLWVLETVMKEGQMKSSVVFRNASVMIIQIMGVLKKFKKDNNICGISYLIPIVVNLKTLLPKAWNHAAKRRPQIQVKLNQYSEFMLQNKYKIQQLGDQAILWRETLFTISERMVKSIQHKKGGINIQQHSKFYDQFLSHILHYRNKSKQIISQSKFQLELAHETNSGFNILLLENYLVKKYQTLGAAQCWNQLFKKAQAINDNISQSVLADILDFCFIGSTQRYKQVDL